MVLFLYLQEHIDLGGYIGSSETDDMAIDKTKVEAFTEGTLGSPLAMWETEIQDIELEKGDTGLGFSILDYQVNKISTNCML